ncbi:CSC1-like protein At3g54510 isoform X3 [Cucumis melo]|uniref:CSC1-like protein At3g54510 isoform X3 n=1 Tax=Cucumis melo TaxID=3656 RepID=A0ABM3LA66_CUCME|nr:CSC1-like protein At3g54510 isoform X3 [Cucumis melo]XP_050946931.1 CSC1-like protein At3g54510 isoform X3 [Cucumis melo]
MDSGSLFASAAINIGLALIVLSIFSILKKQPSNAAIYYARRLSLRHRISFEPFTFHRLLPSVAWIPRAFRVSEDEILSSGGLDALVTIRLFKLGITFSFVSSLIGLVVLLPVNYFSQDKSSGSYHSLDSLTISNIREGSDLLWVHFSYLCFISFYGIYLLHKEYKGILVKRIQQLKSMRQRSDQFTLLVREIPLCIEHKAHGCNVEHFFSKYHPRTYHSYQILSDVKELDHLLKKAKSIMGKIEEGRKKFGFLNDKREPLLSYTSQQNAMKIALLEEKLRKYHDIIHNLQVQTAAKHKELPVAFVTFKSRLGAALASQSQHSLNPLMWITELAPEPRDVSWKNLAIPVRLLPIREFGVIVGAFLLTIFFAIPVTAVQGIAKFEKLKKWFPPAMAINMIPGLSSIVTGYLPSAILNGFIYVVPFAMLAMAKLAGCVSRSNEEIKACNMVFYFLVGNVFFLSLLSGSLLDELEEYLTHPRNFPSHLASAVSAQADFFATYILTSGLSGFSLEILQPGLLSWDLLKSCLCCSRKEKEAYLYSLPHARIIPFISLFLLIGMVYAVVAPLLLPFLIGYFCLGYVVYVNQIEDVYATTYDTFGLYWPHIHHYIIIGILLMQVTMIGLFGLKSKPAASISTIPLLLITLYFNEHCKSRFLPTFHCYPIQEAMENDELDEKSDELEVNYETAADAYCLPCLQPPDFLLASVSTSTQQLVQGASKSCHKQV